MWRDVALTNKKNIRHALLKLEQRLAHIRENLDTRELALEFERAHHLRKVQPQAESEPRKLGDEDQDLKLPPCLRASVVSFVLRFHRL